MTYARGKHARAECQRCGWDYDYSELVEDGYKKGLRVCPTCYDGPQLQERVPSMNDPVALEHPSPEQFGGTLTITLPVYVLALDILSGQNEPITPGSSGPFGSSENTFKLALYTSAPTTNYSTTNEVIGSGYTAGGASITATQDGVHVTFSNAIWGSSSLTFTHGLVYRTSDNMGVADINFGATHRTRTQGLVIDFPSDFGLLVGLGIWLEDQSGRILQENGFLLLQEAA